MNIYSLLAATGLITLLDTGHTVASQPVDRYTLERVFRYPGDSVDISCYWYWISGNISREGVVNDLKAMKQAGINRAYIGNIGLPPNEAPTGKVRILSAEWWDIMHTALKTAAEENIEIGIFNAPGWSQAGGPWNAPTASMRYLGTRSCDVEGGRICMSLAADREASGQTVKVLAYPLPACHTTIGPATALIPQEAGAMFDGDPSTATPLAAANHTITITPRDSLFAARSLHILPDTKPIAGALKIEVKRNGQWETVKQAALNRTNITKNVGYDVFAPFAIALPGIRAEAIRLHFERMNAGCGIREIRLSSAPIIEKYAEKILAKMHQSPLPYWNEYKWVSDSTETSTGAIPEASITDLTPCVQGDRLECTLPKGKWRIVHAYMQPTGICNSPALTDGQGPEVDRWNRQSLAHHYNSFIGQIRDRIPAADRRTWKTVVCDSYEKATQNFGDDFITHFKAAYGYDPTPWLLTYEGTVVGSQEQSNRFLWDLRRLIADRLAYDHIGGMRQLAQKDGFRLWLENYGHWGFPGEFLQYGGQADDVAGEFWSEGTLGDIENRSASSCAHIYGKYKVYAESFTCGGQAFARYPHLMKQRGDRFFTEGINSTLLHLVISQPDETSLPGLNAPFGNEFNRKNTWYGKQHLFTDYLKRCNYLLQQGRYVADVAYFIGEDTPVMTGVCDPALPPGYQFDYINAEVIENSLSADSTHHLSLPHGTRYRLLVLPKTGTMRPALLRKIMTLVHDGAIVLGPKPQKSPSLQNYPRCDSEVRAMADSLWGPGTPTRLMRVYGKGRVYTGHGIDEIFRTMGVAPDFTAGHDSLLYAHTTQKDRDIYFVSNQSGDTIQFRAQFRTTGAIPSIWNPVTGTAEPVYQTETDGTYTAMPIKLYPLESTFVVFDRTNGGTTMRKGSCPPGNTPRSSTLYTLNSHWRLCLKDMFGHTVSRKQWTLADWSASTDPAVRYFSGQGTYTNTFVVSDIGRGDKVELDLGKVAVMATVKVNGKYVGGVWTPPCRLDISSAVRKGKNLIEIQVDNTWVNRLVGDVRLEPGQRRTTCPNNPYTVDSPLQPAGLIGPVSIHVTRLRGHVKE